MQEKEFNLLDENWIRVRLPDNSVREVSLTDALLNAQNYADLAGEMATQDAAMIRLLIAFPLTIFYRVNPEGKDDPLKTVDQALIRWNELWKMGHFPQEAVKKYLEKWRDRFWLFHPERPFWQVPEATVGTEYGAAKLNGEISESSNKIRLFSLFSSTGKNELTYPQAARWLLHVNGYDDTSAKPKGKNLPSVGAGWLGKIGFIQGQGDNLFETIMLNLTFLQDGQKLWDDAIPCWELDKARSSERTEIAVPNDLAQLLTLQSRRLLLHGKVGKVTGFSLLGGDFFQRENAFTEQMTIWRTTKPKKNEPVAFVPCRHDPSRQFWRDFPKVFCSASENEHRPGIIQWITLLQSKRLRYINPDRQVSFKISGMQYGDKDFFVNDSFDDVLSFQAVLLDETSKAWQARIAAQIQQCEDVARAIGIFAQELAIAAGDKNDGSADPARTQFYFRVDQPFRQWLRGINTDADDPDEKVIEWHEICRRIADNMAKEMIQAVGDAALIGRRVTSKGSGDEKITKLYTAPKAYNEFQSYLWKVYPKDEK